MYILTLNVQQITPNCLNYSNITHCLPLLLTTGFSFPF